MSAPEVVRDLISFINLYLSALKNLGNHNASSFRRNLGAVAPLLDAITSVDPNISVEIAENLTVYRVQAISEAKSRAYAKLAKQDPQAAFSWAMRQLHLILQSAPGTPSYNELRSTLSQVLDTLVVALKTSVNISQEDANKMLSSILTQVEEIVALGVAAAEKVLWITMSAAELRRDEEAFALLQLCIPRLGRRAREVVRDAVEAVITYGGPTYTRKIAECLEHFHTRHHDAFIEAVLRSDYASTLSDIYHDRTLNLPHMMRNQMERRMREKESLHAPTKLLRLR